MNSKQKRKKFRELKYQAKTLIAIHLNALEKIEEGTLTLEQAKNEAKETEKQLAKWKD